MTMCVFEEVRRHAKIKETQSVEHDGASVWKSSLSGLPASTSVFLRHLSAVEAELRQSKGIVLAAKSFLLL